MAAESTAQQLPHLWSAYLWPLGNTENGGCVWAFLQVTCTFLNASLGIGHLIYSLVVIMKESGAILERGQRH